jgi:hypothetical protein
MKRGFLNKSSNKILSSSATRNPVSKLTEPTLIETIPQVPSKDVVHIPTGPIKDFLAPTPTENVLDNWPGIEAGVMVNTVLPPPSQGMDVFTFCLFPPGVKEKVLAIPNFPGPPFMLTALQYKFCIGPVPGAGQGMFAASDLKAGDLIMAERPLLLGPQAMPFVNLEGGVHPDTIMETLVDEKLDPLSRDIFMKLHNCKGPDTSKIRGILDTNSLALKAMPGHDAQYMGVFEHISRINHRLVTATPFLWFYLNLSRYQLLP